MSSRLLCSVPIGLQLGLLRFSSSSPQKRRIASGRSLLTRRKDFHASWARTLTKQETISDGRKMVWRNEGRSMAVKKEREVTKKPRERRRLSFTVNGQVHDL